MAEGKNVKDSMKQSDVTMDIELKLSLKTLGVHLRMGGMRELSCKFGLIGFTRQ